MAADDWIKMRGALLDHPKVIAMTRLLLADPDFRDWLTPGGPVDESVEIVSRAASRCVTVACLMCVWSTARSHGKFDGEDLHLPHSQVSDLDEFANAPGVGVCMQQVGWVEVRKGQPGIFLPRFKEFNVPMTEAERARNYRVRQSQGITATVTRPSRNQRDEKGPIVTTRVRGRSTTTPTQDSTTGARASITAVEKSETATPPASSTGGAAPSSGGPAPIPQAVRDAIARSARASKEPAKRHGRTPRPATSRPAPEAAQAPPPNGHDLEADRARDPEPQATHRDGATVREEGEGYERPWWREEEGILAMANELGVKPLEGQTFEEFEARVLAARGRGPWLDEASTEMLDLVGHFQAVGWNPPDGDQVQWIETTAGMRHMVPRVR